MIQTIKIKVYGSIHLIINYVCGSLELINKHYLEPNYYNSNLNDISFLEKFHLIFLDDDLLVNSLGGHTEFISSLFNNLVVLSIIYFFYIIFTNRDILSMLLIKYVPIILFASSFIISLSTFLYLNFYFTVDILNNLLNIVIFNFNYDIAYDGGGIMPTDVNISNIDEGITHTFMDSYDRYDHEKNRRPGDPEWIRRTNKGRPYTTIHQYSPYFVEYTPTPSPESSPSPGPADAVPNQESKSAIPNKESVTSKANEGPSNSTEEGVPSSPSVFENSPEPSQPSPVGSPIWTEENGTRKTASIASDKSFFSEDGYYDKENKEWIPSSTDHNDDPLLGKIKRMNAEHTLNKDKDHTVYSSKWKDWLQLTQRERLELCRRLMDEPGSAFYDTASTKDQFKHGLEPSTVVSKGTRQPVYPTPELIEDLSKTRGQTSIPSE